ncbi:hypothetical protein ACV229_35765 [Burkholderia sp. MR1-5-21]
MSIVKILDARDRPMTTRSTVVSMLAGMVPHDAAKATNPESSAWAPWLGSPDIELNSQRNHIVSRVQGLMQTETAYTMPAWLQKR